MILNFLLVGLGGALGSMARYGVGRFALTQLGPNSVLPWGTLAVNVIGSFLIGLCLHLLPREHVLRLLLVTGFLGGFTTFSAFSIETLGLLRAPSPLYGFIYIAASVLLSLGAAFLGTQVKIHG